MSANPWMPAALADASIPTWGAINLAVAAVYFVLGLIVSRFFAAYGLFPAAIWLPAGIATVSAMVGSAIVTILANRVVAIHRADKPAPAGSQTAPSAAG